MNKLSSLSAIFLLGLLVCFLSGCARKSNPDIGRGATYEFREGHPEVRFSAMGFLNENNQARVNLAADIVFGSLVFKESEQGLKAQLSVDVDVQSEDNDGRVINGRHYEFNIDQKDQGITSSQDSYFFEKQLDIPAGNYTIYLTVTDKNSQKKVTQSSTISIPDPDSETIGLTNIRMLGKDVKADSSWFPITTYDVPGRVDSLMFMLQVTNNSLQEPLTINSNLMHIKADTSVARPMFYSNYSSSSLAYEGIVYDDKSVVEQSTRKLTQEGSVLIEFKFEQQDRGNYRFEVSTEKEGDEVYKARDFSVKSTNYPALRTPRELARPLIYLMKEGNYEDMMSIKDQDSLKKTVDKFWLKEIGNNREALQVLEKYYNRVEEANKQFSNFKEGWKTDPGMMYILFGPPWYVTRTLGQMEWNYSYNREEPGRTFFYRNPRVINEFYPFNHYLLQRNDTFYSLEYQQRQLWLSGLILSRNL